MLTYPDARAAPYPKALTYLLTCLLTQTHGPRLIRKHYGESALRLISDYWVSFSPVVKLKILYGFYTIISRAYLLTHSLTDSLTHSLTHSLTD